MTATRHLPAQDRQAPQDRRCATKPTIKLAWFAVLPVAALILATCGCASKAPEPEITATATAALDATAPTVCSYTFSDYATGWRTHTWVATDCSNGLPVTGSSVIGQGINGSGNG